jgi:hypothetical protein
LRNRTHRGGIADPKPRKGFSPITSAFFCEFAYGAFQYQFPINLKTIRYRSRNAVGYEVFAWWKLMANIELT